MINTDLINFNNTYNVNSNDISNMEAIEKGSIVEAEVLDIGENKISLKLDNNMTVKVDSENIKSEVKVGDIIKFSVEENKGEKLSLKEIKSTIDTKVTDSNYKAMLSSINVAASEENLKYAKFLNENGAEVQVKNIKSLKELKEKIDYISTHSDNVSLENIISDGFDIGKLTPEILKEFIKNERAEYEFNNQQSEASIQADMALDVEDRDFLKNDDVNLQREPVKNDTVNLQREPVKDDTINLQDDKVKTDIVAKEKEEKVKTQSQAYKSNTEKISAKEEKQENNILDIQAENTTVHSDSFEKRDTSERKNYDEETEKVINEYKQKNDISEERLNKIVEVLNAVNLPVNEKNIDELDVSIEKVEAFKKFTTREIISLLKDEKVLSLKNLYIAKYSYKNTFINENVDEKVWEQIAKDVTSLFERESIEVTDENMEKAKFLFANDIAISKENIESIDFLKKPADYIDEDDIINKMAENISRGNKAEDTVIFGSESKDNFKELCQTYKDVIEFLPKITDENIKDVISFGEVLNISNLQKYFKDKTVGKDVSSEENKAVENEDNSILNKSDEINYSTEHIDTSEVDIDAEIITAKRQIAEIQLKLTTEAAIRLAGKGLDINIMPLKDAVDKLKQIEKEIYESNLKLAGTEVTEKNVEKMTELYEKIESLKPEVPSNIYKEIITQEIEFNINSIDSSLNSKASSVIADLESLATVPSGKYGDSFASVLGQFETVLKANGIEVTEQNLKVAKILSRSNMDITDENLTRVKNIENKMTTTYNKLHPMIAAKIIGDGLNPVDITLDKAIEYINKFSEEYGQTSKEKIASNIMELQENNAFTKEEREAVVSVYRMLNIINKHDSASIGVAVQSGMELTLGNLMDAAKVFEKVKSKNSTDIKVDDSFGEVKEVITSDKNIRGSIERALSSNTSANTEVASDDNTTDIYTKDIDSQMTEGQLIKEEYSKSIIKEINDLITPEKISLLLKSDKNIQAMNIENIVTRLKNIKADDRVEREYIKNAIQQIKEISESPANVMKWLNQNNVPLTLSNIQAMTTLLKEPFKSKDNANKLDKLAKEKKIEFGKKIQSTALEELIQGKNPEELTKDFEDEIEGVQEELIEKVDNTEELNLALKQVSELKRFTSLQTDINGNDNGKYEIPVRLSDGEITNLNLFITNAENTSNGEFKTLMSLNTEELGNINIYMDIKDSKLDLKINSDSVDTMKYLENNEKSLIQFIKNSGFELNSLEFKAKNSEAEEKNKNYEKNLQENVKIFNNNYEILV